MRNEMKMGENGKKEEKQCVSCAASLGRRAGSDGLVDDRGSRDGTADADKQGRQVHQRAVVGRND